MDKTKGLLLMIASVGLILVAIVFTTLMDKSNNKPTDVRARASKSGSMTFTAVVTGFDDTKNVLLVENMKFADTEGKTLGSWEITPPGKFDVRLKAAGTRVRIAAVASSFQIATKTLIAGEIEKE